MQEIKEKVGVCGEMKYNDFNEDIKYSLEHDDFWENIYKQAFPDYLSIITISNRVAQGMGIDKILISNKGEVIAIEEKLRREDWPDFALEYESSPGSPGWIEKNLKCNYFAYAFEPSKTVYLFKWSELQTAWFENKEEWFKEYEIKYSNNKGYTTLSLCIPKYILLDLLPNTQMFRYKEEL